MQQRSAAGAKVKNAVVFPTCGALPPFDWSLAAKLNNGKDKTNMFSVLLNPAANIKAVDVKPASNNGT